MKRKSISQILHSLLVVLLVLISTAVHAQESPEASRNKSIFVEFLGSGATIVTANFDMRFKPGGTDGWGMRIGIGGGSLSEDPVIGEGSSKTKTFTVPIEVNYVLGKGRLAFEAGCSVTYVSISEDSTFQFLGEYSESHESEDLIVSYIPIGFRLNPKSNGFMLKLNGGPLFNYSAPNLYSDYVMNFWGGLAIGYSFY